MVNGDDLAGVQVEVLNGGVRATTSLIQTEVIPKLIRIGRGSPYTMGHMQGLPSPSKTSMLAKTSGGTAGTDATGGREVTGAKDGISGGKQKSTLSPHIRKEIVPAYTSIFARAVARNGL